MQWRGDDLKSINDQQIWQHLKLEGGEGIGSGCSDREWLQEAVKASNIYVQSQTNSIEKVET